jgi:hypothetical protein
MQKRGLCGSKPLLGGIWGGHYLFALSPSTTGCNVGHLSSGAVHPFGHSLQFVIHVFRITHRRVAIGMQKRGGREAPESRHRHKAGGRCESTSLPHAWVAPFRQRHIQVKAVGGCLYGYGFANKTTGPVIAAGAVCAIKTSFHNFNAVPLMATVLAGVTRLLYTLKN